MSRDITTLRELREVTATGKTMLIFHAEWCGPCKAYRGIYERVDRNNADITLVRADVDQAPELKEHFGIRSVPTTILIKDGKVEAKNGPVPYGSLVESLQ